MIATDEVRSYALFNYLHMGWTTHTEAGGDGNEGQGGIPAYVSSVMTLVDRACGKSRVGSCCAIVILGS